MIAGNSEILNREFVLVVYFEVNDHDVIETALPEVKSNFVW